MSRVGQTPVPVPSGVEVSISGADVTVKGPKGELSRTMPPEVSVESDGKIVQVNRRDEHRRSRAMHGLGRALLANMVIGVSTGFTKKLEINGVGYRAEVKPDSIRPRRSAAPVR